MLTKEGICLTLPIPSLEEAAGLLSAGGQELGRNQEKAGCSGVGQRLNGLDMVGKGACSGSLVDVDFGENALYIDYTPSI